MSDAKNANFIAPQHWGNKSQTKGRNQRDLLEMRRKVLGFLGKVWSGAGHWGPLSGVMYIAKPQHSYNMTETTINL